MPFVGIGNLNRLLALVPMARLPAREAFFIWRAPHTGRFSDGRDEFYVTEAPQWLCSLYLDSSYGAVKYCIVCAFYGGHQSSMILV